MFSKSPLLLGSLYWFQRMETNLDIILDKMRTASSEKKLKKSLENACSCLDGIRAGYGFCSANLIGVCESCVYAVVSWCGNTLPCAHKDMK